MQPYEWFGLGLLSAMGCGGTFLMYVPVRGSKDAVDKAANVMHAGGDIVGVLFVLAIGLLALPIGAFFRALTTPPNE